MRRRSPGRLPQGSDVWAVMGELQRRCMPGVASISVRVASQTWAFRTAADLAWLLSREDKEQKKLSRAAIETLAIIAYPPAGHPRRYRGGARRRRLQRCARRAAGERLGAHARQAQGAGPADHLRHDHGFPRPFWPGVDRRLAWPRRIEGPRIVRRQAPRHGFGVPAPTDDAALATDEDPMEVTAAVVEAYGAQGEEAEASEPEEPASED